MKVWILDSDVDTYENIMWEKEIDIEFIQSFDGTEKKRDWIPVPVKRMYMREFSDTPGLSPHIPVFSEKAASVLNGFLEGNAEMLPLDCADGIFYAVNVTAVLNCIDYQRSKYKTFRDGKRIMRFMEYAFDAKKIEGVHIFKIKDEPLKRPFVSEEFKKTAEENCLTGFRFELAWSDGQD